MAAGVDGSQGVREVTLGTVAAIVSSVALDAFCGPEAEARAHDPNWVVPRALRHQQVVQEVMGRSPVLPARYGAVFSSDARLAEIARPRADEIAGFLNQVAGKEEWSVRGTLEESKAAAWLREHDAALAGHATALSQAPGARYLHERKLRDAARERLGICRAALAAEIQHELDAAGVDSRPMPLRAWKGLGKATHLAFHRAYLLPREAIERFRALVRRATERRLAQGLSLESTGPWPPYSFAPALWEREASAPAPPPAVGVRP